VEGCAPASHACVDIVLSGEPGGGSLSDERPKKRRVVACGRVVQRGHAEATARVHASAGRGQARTQQIQGALDLAHPRQVHERRLAVGPRDGRRARSRVGLALVAARSQHALELGHHRGSEGLVAGAGATRMVREGLIHCAGATTNVVGNEQHSLAAAASSDLGPWRRGNRQLVLEQQCVERQVDRGR
jgi:hypothetical protein